MVVKGLVTLVILCLGYIAQAREVVLLSGFGPFGGYRTNSSWMIAQSLAQRLSANPDIDVHTCLLPTTYAGAYPKLQDCYERLPAQPTLVLSMGEGPCELTLETQVYNMDHNPRGSLLRGGSNPDNAGVRRFRRTIIAGAPFSVGLRVDAEAAFCSLTAQEEASTAISATPGNFVCNNAAFQFTWNHPEVPFTFAHVIGQKCDGRDGKIAATIVKLEKIVLNQLAQHRASPRSEMPHPSNSVRLPVNRSDIVLRREQALPGCAQSFWSKLLSDLPAARQ